MNAHSDSLNEKAVLVTGASRGIGRGIALELAKRGAAVAINYSTNETAAEETLKAVCERGGSGVVLQGDISDSGDRKALVDAVVERFGRFDALVNNAGIAPSVRADILEASEASFDTLVAVNLKGPYFLTQLAANAMIELIRKGKQNTGTIITVSSVSAYTASVNRGDYCISKAGLSMLTKLYAARLAEEHINVYEIRPGIVETDMTGPVKDKYDKLIAGGLTPIHCWGKPEDVGLAAAAILEGALPFSTGEVINVDGGFHLRTL